MPTDAAQPSAAVTPGTIATGRPASRKASTSSPPRPNTKGSPAFSRTTVWPARTRRTSSALISSCAQRAWPFLALADRDELGIATSARQDRRRHEIVVQDGVGLLQELRGLERQKIGIARAGADDMGDADRRQPATGVVELAERGAPGAGIVAGQRPDAPPVPRPADARRCGGGRDRRSGR